MIINGATLLTYAPIMGMIPDKRKDHGVSYGLTEAGYDIRIKQDVTFHTTLPYYNPDNEDYVQVEDGDEGVVRMGRFTLASSIEEFNMPSNLVGVVHDKSTWARRGLSVFNTVIEPGWKGFLTLELVYHGRGKLHIPAGAGIAQVLFHRIAEQAEYTGKYQGQEDKPVEAIMDR